MQLVRHTARRYSQLRPPDVEGNLFAYHLKGLQREGLIEKGDSQEYQLTASGLQLAGTLSLSTGRTRQQPKLLNTVVARNGDGEYLFSRWRRQPNAGLVSFPHGMMHYGKPVVVMAASELAEKAGLKASMRYRGDVYVRGLRGGEVDRHMLVHVFDAHDVQPDPHAGLRPDVAESFWARLSDLAPEDFVPGFYEIAQMVDARPTGLLFDDITVDIS